jgi:hypothetical protein
MKQPQHAVTTGLSPVGWVRCTVATAGWSRWMGAGSPDFQSLRALANGAYWVLRFILYLYLYLYLYV